MNAITLWQPWASLIAAGVKTIETRTHDRFRRLAGSRIAIHAAVRRVSYREARAIQDMLIGLGVENPARTPAWLQRLPLAALVCTVYVDRFDILNHATHATAACCEIGRNCFGLFLEDVRNLQEPIPYKGARGIWHVPDHIIPEYAR